MVPSSLSIIDLAEISWDSVVVDSETLCIRSPLQNSSARNSGESVVAWRSVDRPSESILKSDSEKSPPATAWYQNPQNSSNEWSVWYSQTPSGLFHVAIVPSELFLDRLVKQYGPPPSLILRDWFRQATQSLKKSLFSKSLTGIAIASDGILRFVPDTRYERTSSSTPIDDPTLIRQLNKHAKLLARKHKEMSTETASKETLSSLLESQGLVCSKVSVKPSRVATDLFSSSLGLAPAKYVSNPLGLSKPSNANQTNRKKGSIASDSTLSHRFLRQPWAIPTAAGAILALSALTYALWPSQMSSPRETTSSQSTSTATEPEYAAADVTPSAEVPLDSELTLDTTTTTPNDLKLTVSNELKAIEVAPALEVDLAKELQEKLMQGSDGDSADSELDPSKLASITSLLSSKMPASGPASKPDLNSASETELKSFNESFDDAQDESAEDPAMQDSAAESNDDGTEVLTEKSFTVVLKRSVEKQEFRIPFPVNAKQASVRAEWSFPDDVLITPETPVVISGKQEHKWTIALKDESSKLSITIRSKPGRKWLIGSIVKVQRSDGAEFPIALGDAQVMQQQHIARSKSLKQQIEALEMIKGSRGGRAYASYFLPIAKASLKESDAAVDQWIEVEALVNSFYTSHSLKLTFLAAPL